MTGFYTVDVELVIISLLGIYKPWPFMGIDDVEISTKTDRFRIYLALCCFSQQHKGRFTSIDFNQIY